MDCKGIRVLVAKYDSANRLREPLRKLHEATAKGPYDVSAEFQLYERFLNEYWNEHRDEIQNEEKERIKQAIDECKNIQVKEHNMK